jgi:hypothetical protein
MKTTAHHPAQPKPSPAPVVAGTTTAPAAALPLGTAQALMGLAAFSRQRPVR